MFKKILPSVLICIFFAVSAFGASLQAHHKMSGELKDLVAKKSDAASKKVIFYAKDVSAASKYIKSRGGSVLRKKKNLITAQVPINSIEDIVGSTSDITYARLPRKFIPFKITSEGVSLTQANILQNAGITGSGVKIAVLDVGFIGLATAKSKSELPANLITRDFTGSGIESTSQHGVACAEIIYDMAPGAQLYLLKVDDETDISEAADYCKTNGIKIVSASIGTFGTGPGNGTGSVDEICDDMKANGILVVASAGNFGNTTDGSGTPVGTHWRGTFIDSGRNFSFSGIDNDENQFIPGDSDSWYNVIEATFYSDGLGHMMTEVAVAMRWDDWPTANSDYDMFLLDYDTDAIVASSTAVQNGSQPPLEFLDEYLTGTTQSKLYKLIITKKPGSPAGKEVEILLGGACAFVPFGSHSSPIATSVGSICEPGDSASVFTVGAIDRSKWTTGPQEDFSSQGPTNAWGGLSARIKPDICGPDGTSGYTYGTGAFYGTSASCPHVAGAAALVLAMHPQYSVDQLKTAIEANAIDMGSAGKDNVYGSGRLVVNKSINTTPVLEWTGEQGYTSDGLEPDSGNGSTPYIFRIKYKDSDGDAPWMHDLYIDKNGDGDYLDTGEVVTMTATGSDYKTGVIYTCTINVPYSSKSSNCSYYFRFWDAVSYPTGNITTALSLITAINKPDVFQSLSLTIDRTNWQLSGITAGSEYLSDNTNKVKVSNAGDGPQAYSLKMISEGNGWSASSAKDGADVNKFVLSAIFSPVSQASIDPSYFNEAGDDDVVPISSATKASAAYFGTSKLAEGGFSVLPGSDRNLWFEFKAPTKDTIRATQSISVTINAETQ